MIPSERGIPQCVGVFPKVQGYSMEHPPTIEEHPCTVGNTCTHWGTSAHTVEHLPQLITPLLTVEHSRTVGSSGEHECIVRNACAQLGTPYTVCQNALCSGRFVRGPGVWGVQVHGGSRYVVGPDVWGSRCVRGPGV